MTRRVPVELPDPATRVSAHLYSQVRSALLEHDPDAAELLHWSQSQIAPPKDADSMAREIVWIILCAGRSAQASRTLEKRIWAKIDAGGSAFEAFGYRAKANAIDRAWSERDQDFAALQAVLTQGSKLSLVEWCGSLPFVGKTTRWQLAKNFGCSVPKPDIWLARLAGIPDRPRLNDESRFNACMALCRPLAEASGDSIATVDTLLWNSCNKGFLVVSAEAGPITFAPTGAKRRSIFEAAA